MKSPISRFPCNIVQNKKNYLGTGTTSPSSSQYWGVINKTHAQRQRNKYWKNCARAKYCNTMQKKHAIPRIFLRESTETNCAFCRHSSARISSISMGLIRAMAAMSFFDSLSALKAHKKSPCHFFKSRGAYTRKKYAHIFYFTLCRRNVRSNHCIIGRV